MGFLQCLPTDVLRNQLLPFLPLSDWVALDTACCCKELRPHLLTAYYGCSHLPYVDSDVGLLTGVVRWLMLKKFSFRHITFHHTTSNDAFLAITRNPMICNVLTTLDCDTHRAEAWAPIFDVGITTRAVCKRSLTEASLLALAAHCIKLHTVNLAHCLMLSDESIVSFAALIESRLEVLDLTACPVSDIAIFALSKHCTGITSLKVNACLKIGDDSLSALVSSLNNLNTIELEGLSISDSFLHILAANGRYLKRLHAKGCDMITDQGIAHVLNNCQNLTYLNINDSYALSDNLLCNILPVSSSRINALFVGSKNGTHGASPRSASLQFAFSSLCWLISLDVSYNSGITDDIIIDIALNQRAIKCFVLDGCSLITNESIKAISTYMTQLSKLSISYCDNPNLTSIEGLATISDIDLSYCRHVEETSVQTLMGNILNIQTFIANGVRFKSESTVSAILRHSSLVNLSLSLPEGIHHSLSGYRLHSLKTLSLCDLNIDFDGAILCSLIHMQVWSVDFSDKDMKSIINTSAALTSLDVAGNSKLTDSCLQYFFRRMTMLESVDISSIEGITDGTIHTLTEFCPRLYSLQARATNITDESLISISTLGENLIVLDVDFCIKLTDEGVCAIVERCPNLRIFSILVGVNVLQRSVDTITTSCTNLELLTLTMKPTSGINLDTLHRLHHTTVSVEEM